MAASSPDYPQLRPVEAIPDTQNACVILRDPTQLATGMLVVGFAELTLLSLLDGQRRRTEIRVEYARRSGQLLPAEQLDEMLEQLEGAGFLAGERFESYYAGLVEQYRRAPNRPLRDPNGFGAPVESLRPYFEEALAEGGEGARGRGGEGARGRTDEKGRLVGIVTPHLDYPRGRVCYGAGYQRLRAGEAPRRVVVLGTNHFGRSQSVTATAQDFQTPWGVVPTDREFLERLQAACAGNLLPYELDHLREHSIELQVLWLHHLLGDDVRIVPVLCPDPSGPLGTRPGDEGGADLREFALALRRLIREDPEPTLLIASADLSHVGGYFGDEHPLDAAFLEAVRQSDEAALAHVDAHDPEAFREHMARTGNPTRVCSVGCLYALMVALSPEARPHRLRYHQAVTPEFENCVTCAAFAFYEA
jgi:AmmeMemoRadiSam system protein B